GNARRLPPLRDPLDLAHRGEARAQREERLLGERAPAALGGAGADALRVERPERLAERVVDEDHLDEGRAAAIARPAALPAADADREAARARRVAEAER